jgi:glycosyltransferase involved in cell wall biosynthesis
MPTKGRKRWAQEACVMFFNQTYPRKELVIVDDASDPSFNIFSPPLGTVFSVERHMKIGEKRNLAVSRASGEIIMHWDSDDIYRADRMAYQAAFLIESGAQAVGFNVMEFIDEERKERYEYRAKVQYAIGVSLCYWRDTWERKKFNPVDSGEDNDFIAGLDVRSVPADGRIVARIHSGNTAEKRKLIPQNTAQWRRLTPPPGV